MRPWTAIVLLALGLMSCESTGSGHLLREQIGGSLARIAKRLDPQEQINAAAQRLGKLRHTAVALAPWSDDSLHRISQARQQTLELARRQIGAPRRIANTVSSLAQHEVKGAKRVLASDSTLRTLLSPSEAAHRLRRAVESIPVVLGLTSQPLPSPTDRARQTGITPAERRETWVERILRRIKL